jgi:hypothetical protein
MKHQYSDEKNKSSSSEAGKKRSWTTPVARRVAPSELPPDVREKIEALAKAKAH